MDNFFAQPQVLNGRANFVGGEGWGSGFALAAEAGAGNGVVVGPGFDNPNIFSQEVNVVPGALYGITTRAMSVDGIRTKGAVQINWMGEGSKFVTVDQQGFDVYPFAVSHRLVVQAPATAKTGVLYVVPGQPIKPVRYLEMSFREVGAIERSMASSLFGIPASALVTDVLILTCLTVSYLVYRRFWFQRTQAVASGRSREP